MFRTKRSLWDVCAAAAVLAVALLLCLLPLLGGEEGSVLLISTPEGETRYSLDTDRECTVHSRGIELCIVILDGEARVEAGTCPDGICRESHAISRVGETILCAPAGVRISVIGEGEYDFVAG